MKHLYLVLFLFLNSFLLANEKTTYGLGVSFISLPSYIGSDKQINKVLPFPYIEYKGKYFNVDRDKIYNEFYDKNRLKMELSLRGMLPSKSKGTSRVGMPNLDAILEIGPKLAYSLKNDKKTKITLEIPLRGAFSVSNDSFFEYQGFLASLGLKYKYEILKDFNFTYSTGVNYNSKKINSYYYDVSSNYSNASRNIYSSSSGYSGWHNSFALTKKEKRFWYGTFLKYYHLDSAVFEDSPVVDKKNATFYGLAFSYLF